VFVVMWDVRVPAKANLCKAKTDPDNGDRERGKKKIQHLKPINYY